jgi:hypothetical protein
MRFAWDSRLHSLLVLSALALAIAFVVSGVADRREYTWGLDTVTSDGRQ